MQIKAEQLERQLKSGLAPIYLVGGEETLLVQEATDAIRSAARLQEYSSREVFSADRGFDWDSLSAESNNLSLFSERRILEIRIPTGRPGDAGAKVLRGFAERPPTDTLLLVICGKLDASARRTKWVQALSAAGVFVPVWSIDARHLHAWIQARMQRKGMHATPEAVTLLAERVEGNLLACAQEIDKLYLLHGAGQIDGRLIANSVGDSARFGVFLLIDSAMDGAGIRCQRILNSLQAEGVDPVAILGALAWELRKLIAMSRAVACGKSVSQVLASFRVWDSRKATTGRALERYSYRSWQACLARCAHLDQVAKGQAAGNIRDEMLQLVLGIAGTKLAVKPGRVSRDIKSVG